VIGISLDEDRAALERFIRSHDIRWAQIFDGKGWESPLARQYGINSIPATFLIDRDGRIIAKNLRGEDLMTSVSKALGNGR
jgi:peroxiredoxin